MTPSSPTPRDGVAHTSDVVAALWIDAGLPSAALARLSLTGAEPALPSSFAVGTAAQSAIAVAALAATEIGRQRNGVEQTVQVDMHAAVAECTGRFSIDGRVPDIWDKLSGLYRGANGWLRVHANFAHHRDGVLRLLGLVNLNDGAQTPRSAVEAALATRDVFAFEDAAAQAGLVVAAVRRFDEWDAHAQGQAVAAQPLITWERIGDAPPQAWPAPPALPATSRPLTGIKVLDLTRILAGPTAGRALAAYGAEVMLVNAPHLPNIDSIMDTSRGKLSCHADLRTFEGCDSLQGLLRQAQVFVQGYRPGGLATVGFGADQVAALRPGIVCVSLSAYGHTGPWAGRRGFDSLVQTATGFNDAERHAAGATSPQAMPAQILDYSAGFLIAFAAQAALLRQATEGGSWHLRISLARTAQWLREMGRVPAGLAMPKPALDDCMQDYASGWGALRAMRHAARLSHTPPGWDRPSVPPGTHAARWPVG